MKADDFLDAPSADDFLADAEPAGPDLSQPYRSMRPLRRRPIAPAPVSVLETAAWEPAARSTNPAAILPQPADPVAAGMEALFNARTPVQAAVSTVASQARERRRQQQIVDRAREDTDSAFGGPVGQAIAAFPRRLTAGAAQVVGGVAGIPALFGSDLGSEVASSMDLMAKANMPADPGLADEVAAGLGQVFPMVRGAMAVRAAAKPVLGAEGATTLAAGTSGAAGGAMSGGQVLRDLEGREDLTSDDKQLRAVGAAIFSALTGAKADRFLLPGATPAGSVMAAGAQAFGREGLQEGADQAMQNLFTDRPVGEGVGKAAAVGGVVGGLTRSVNEMGSDAFQLSSALDADAAALANDPPPRSVWAPTQPVVTPAAPVAAPSAESFLDAPITRGETNAPALAPVAQPAGPADAGGAPVVAAAPTVPAGQPAVDQPPAGQPARAEVGDGPAPAPAAGQPVQAVAPTGARPDIPATDGEVEDAPVPEQPRAPAELPPAGPVAADAAGRGQDAGQGALSPVPQVTANTPAAAAPDPERVKADIRARMGLEPDSAPAEADPMRYAQSPLIRGIAAEGGIDVSERSDAGIDRNRATRGRVMPNPINVGGKPLFRVGGKKRDPLVKAPLRGDALVEHLVQGGYLTQQEVEQADRGGVGGSEELAWDIVRRELEAPGSVKPGAERVDQIAAQATARVSDDLERQAQAIGFDTKGLDDGQVAAALGRIERRRARNRALDAKAEARAERQAMQDADAFTAEQLDALDVPWLEGSNVSARDAMMALGFDPQEIDAYEAGQAEDSRRPGPPDGDAGRGAPRAGPADEGSEGRPEGQASPEQVVREDQNELFPQNDLDAGPAGALPTRTRGPDAARPDVAPVRRDAPASSAVPRRDEPGEFYVEAFVATQRIVDLGVQRITTPAEAAQATQYLARSAVERFDGIVTDKDGKPLAVVGGFKGALSQTSVYPATLMAEAIMVPGAARIWLSHNHPSGSPQLSGADSNMSRTVADVFKGSGIEVAGILAIGKGRFMFESPRGDVETGALAPAGKGGAKVPALEREQRDERQAPLTISSPQGAKVQAEAFYNRAKKPGLLLLDAQNQISGWLPIPPVMLGKLRDTGGLAALYRGISRSNAAAVIMAHAGELDAVLPNGATVSANIGSALRAVDVRPLDAINVKSKASTAEAGGDLGSRTVYSRSAPAGTSTAESIRTELRGRFGDLAGRLEKRGLLKVWGSIDEFNAARGQESRLPDDARGVQGMYVGGVAHLFSDGIEPGNAVPVFLHEVGEHASMRAMLGDKYAGLVRRAYRMASDGDQVAEAAMARIPEDTPDKFYDSEMLAYMIEEAAGAKQKASPGLRKWLAEVVSAIRAWFYGTGFNKTLSRYGKGIELTAEDIVALAERAVRWQAEQGEATPSGEPAMASLRPESDRRSTDRTVEVDGKRRPDSNADGKPITPPEQGMQATVRFWRWFKDSAVVDDQGRPLVVYHGTRSDIQEFDPAKSQRLPGIWLTPDPKLASTYAAEGVVDARSYREGANVMPLYARIERPYVVDPKKKPFYSAWQEYLDGDYDGLIEHGNDTKDVTTLVVRSGEQIKSATGNAGSFSADDADIRMSRAPSRTGGTNAPNSAASGANSWTVSEPSSWDSVVRTMQDNKVDLKRVRDAVEKHLGRMLADDQDAYMGEGLYHGKVAERIKRLHRERVEPILAKIAVAGKNNGVTIDDVNEYLHARHAPEANAQMAAINPGPGNNALSGMSNAEAAAAIARLRTAGKEAALQAIAKDVWSLLGDVRTDLVADGLEEAPTVWMWEQAYKHYVPLYRDMDSDVRAGTPKGQGFAVKGPEAKRRTGSDRAVVDILANVVGQAETAAIRAEKAEVGRQLLEMVENNPNPDFWTVDTPKTKRVIDPATGLVTTQTIGLNGNEPNVVPVKNYGVTRYVVFNERNDRAMMVARAMKNLDVAQVHPILQWAGKGTRFMASLLTQRNPEFWLTNLARDLQGVAIQLGSTDAAGVQAQVAKNLPSALAGMRDLVRNDGTGLWARRAQELKDLGGTTGYMESFATSTDRMAALEKEVAKMQQGKADPRRVFRSVIDFIDDYNDIIENGVRLAVFQAARDAGISDARAAWISKNITVNFNKKGNLSAPINTLYMFANASVQGTARMMEAVVKSRQVQAIVGGIAMAGFVMDIVNRAMAGDDDETGKNRYDMISQHEKATNWIFMRGEGKYVKVPMPLGYNIFHTAGRLFADAFNRKDPRDAAEYGWSMATMMAGAFLPIGGPTMAQTLAPSLLDPVAQLDDNKSFMGGPVYRSADMGFGKIDPRPAYTRYFDSTPDTWKQMSKGLNSVGLPDMVMGMETPKRLRAGDAVKPGPINIEPDILRHVYGALTGGPGRALDRSLDASQASARGEKLPPSRYPLVSRFAGEVGDKEQNSAYLEEQKRVAKATSQHDYFLKERRRDLADEIAKDVGDGDMARGRRLMAEFKRTDKDVRQINAAIRKLRQDKVDDTAQAAEFQRLKDQRTRIRSAGLRRATAGTDSVE